ncbi:hypothetical protein [Myxococcus stipitatus]|uniref:hypothetical protein n=1 Tax=Myxococcus stipitatus TaxID=83455 RepID=UPI001E318894|nr:hypothetical protein [Myxococcus stipitatus]
MRTAQALVLALAVSCGEASDIGVPSRDETFDDGWKAFRAQVVESAAHPGVFIVEGDIAIRGEEALREYFKEHSTRVSQSLTVSLRRVVGNAIVDDVWPAGRRGLTYCISNAFDSTQKDEVKAAMEIAGDSWSRRVGVSFGYIPSEDDICDLEQELDDTPRTVTFAVRPAPVLGSNPYEALAFYPSALRKDQILHLGPSAFTSTAWGKTLEGRLRHELGHVLGFRHEHMWAVPTPDCSAEDLEEEDVGAPGHEDDARLLVGGYDTQSVMHYHRCRPPGSSLGYAQTETDYRAAISIYGLAPSLIVSAVTTP